ncbi:hypothetical protein HELRODRAFT_166954 [Helobdella robusta]|uniref:Uncharacterized protein n=1 Tax=Helobdella robusta TaxID=6412 RepID=T1EYT0_HELRO|nr:hypothetical protein HELRODRAFT_166954 [Helobdella robusta]ESO11873.1 hypothetical protein HELRODRAFT_166954 [Helobdella robusta]
MATLERKQMVLITCMAVLAMENGMKMATASLSLLKDKGNYKAMVKYIDVNLWKNYNEISNLDLYASQEVIINMWIVFKSVILEAANIFVPTFGFESPKLKFSDELECLIRLKRNTWEKYSKSKDIMLFNKFKSIRNQIKRKIYELKSDIAKKFAKFFNSDFCSDAGNNENVHFENNFVMAEGEMIPLVLLEEIVCDKMKRLEIYKSAGPDNICGENFGRMC